MHDSVRVTCAACTACAACAACAVRAPYCPCRAVPDVGSTPVGSTGAVKAAWTVRARADGVEPAAVLAVCHGLDATTTVRRFLQGIGEAELAGHVAAHLERECADPDGIRPALAAPSRCSWWSCEGGTHMGGRGPGETIVGFRWDSAISLMTPRWVDSLPCAQTPLCAHGSESTHLDDRR